MSMSQIVIQVILNSIKIIKVLEVLYMIFRGLKDRFTGNKDYCLCTKELVTNVDEILLDKEIKRDKPSLYTLQRLLATKQATSFAVTMLEDINGVLSQMIDNTRQPDLVRYNNIVEAKLAEYEKILDRHIEYKGIEIFDVIQHYIDDLARYGEACYELSEDILYKISKVIVDNNSILKNCRRSTLMAFNCLMIDEHKKLVDKYYQCIDESDGALVDFVDLIKGEAD